MTGPDQLMDACTDSLTACLQEVASSCPALSAGAPALQRLRELAPAHQTSLASPARDMTLENALELLANARRQLDLLEKAGADSPIGSELRQALSATVDDLAAGLGQEIRARQASRVRGLYVIIDPEVTGGREPIEIARASVRGGARMLQLRDKLRDKGEILPLALELQELCRANDVLLVINDHVDLAAAVGSGGVHVGPDRPARRRGPQSAGAAPGVGTLQPGNQSPYPVPGNGRRPRGLRRNLRQHHQGRRPGSPRH